MNVRRPNPRSDHDADAAPAAPKVRKRDSQATRATLLATAERLFVAKGFDGTRIDEIAEDAGINKRMLYVYFGNKEQVYAEVLRTNFEGALALGRVGDDPSVDPVQQAETIIRRYFRFVADHPEFVRLLGWESLGERSAEMLAKMIAVGLEDLQAVLRRGKEQGAFRPDLDEQKIVLSVSALCIGYFSRRSMLAALWGRDLGSAEVQHELLDHILSLVMHGILPRESGTQARAARKPARGA